MYDTITNYNDRNHVSLYYANIRKAKYQVILEDQSESNNFTVDTFSTHINESENLINEVHNLTVNKVRKI